MKLMHNLTISVFIEKEEDEKNIVEAIAILLPKNFVNETQSTTITGEEESKIPHTIQIKIETIKIQEGRDIRALKVILEKERHTKNFIKNLKELLGKEQCEIISLQENRVDKEGKLFIRIDKTDFIEHHKATLVDHGNCLHIKILMAAYPKTQSKAIKIAKELFS